MDTSSIFVVAILHLAGAIPLLLLLLRVQRGRRCRLPPGPPSVLALASLVWLTSSPAEVELEPFLRRLFARYGPVVSLRVGCQVAIFVADRRLAHAALIERGAALADRLPSVVGEDDHHTITRGSYGPLWRLLRRNLVAGTLHPSRAQLFRPARSLSRRVLLEKLRETSGGETAASVTAALQHAMFGLFFLMCFGERLDEAAVLEVAAGQRDHLLHSMRKMEVFAVLPSVTKHLLRGRLRTANAMRRRKKELFLPLLNARRELKSHGGEPKKETTFKHAYVDTLLDIKLPEEGDRPLTDDELVNLCSEFLTAGSDTTSSGLQWIMAELVKNPDIQEKLYSEIKATTGDDDDDEVSEEGAHRMPYLRAVVLEGLRKHPPGHFVLPHKAAEDVEVGGYLIPKGAMVNFMVAEMGRDEREWQRPTEFLTERFLRGGDGEGVDLACSKRIRMMPFGVGRRMCAGLSLAVLHLEYFVANMVREFEWKEIAGDEVDLAETSELTVMMKKPLRPLLVPRRN